MAPAGPSRFTPRVTRTLIRALCLCCCLAAGAAVAAEAQAGARPDSAKGKVTVLSPVTVTGKRELAVAPPVSTIEVGPEVVQRAPASNPYDMIGRAAGIEVHQQGQGPGFASDVVIGGFTSDHSSDVLLVLDGVPINLPIHGHVEGYADWSILSPGAISATRVIHGPASPLYGDFSIGGVIEMYTGADANGPTASLGVTSFGDVRGWVSTGFQHPHDGGFASIALQREQGWRDNADYFLGTGVLRGWRAVGTGRIEGGFYAYGSDWNSPGYVSVADYNQGHLTGATDTTDGGDAHRYIANLRYGAPLAARTTLQAQVWGQLGHSTVFLTIPEDGVLDQTGEHDDRSALGMQAEVNRATDAGEFTIGMSGRADWTTYTLDRTEERVTLTPRQGNDGRYQAIGAFARWRGMLGSHLLYDLGLRADEVRYQSLDKLDSLATWQEATDPMVSPKLGARYILSDRVVLLGSLARGFRGPVGVIADPGLPLVTAWAGELGAQYAAGPVQLGLSFFQFNVANERVRDPVTLEVLDAGTSRRRGATVNATWRLGRHLSLLAAGTVNDATVTGIAQTANVSLDRGAIRPPRPSFHDVPLEPGDPVPGVSKYFGRIGAEYIVRTGLSAYGLVRFTGPYTPIGEPTITTQPYAVVDAGASFGLGLTTSLDVDLLNITDAKYPELRASGYINPGAPRSVLVSVRLTRPN
jgi:outer membrane receptor for Fe3+-dicitrate